MNYLNEVASNEDNAFGPETDLILSLLVIVLLVGVLAWFQGTYLVKKKEEVIQRNERKLVFQEKASTFSRGSAEIRAEDETQLRLKVEAFENAIRAGSFQYLEIAGAASPEVGGVTDAFDINLIKGYQRAQAVAKILHSAGLPYECTKLSSYGRASSEYLIGLIKEQSPNRAADVLRAFDKNLADSRAHEAQIAGERRTEIWGIPPARNDDGALVPSVCMLLLQPNR